jgi:hypothetical protein
MKHKYHALEWKATDIATFLGLSVIYRAVFNFDKPALGHFRLLVAGFDDKGNLLGTSPMEKYPGIPEPDLDNAYTEGLFFVMVEEIKTLSANGTKTLYFVPTPYTPPGGTQLYVSYTIYDTHSGDGSFDGQVVVGSINPSPPRNA